MKPPLRMLFLCTGNSCRSLMAEALANQLGPGRVRAVSAGSAPADEANHHALEVLRRHRFHTEGLRPEPVERYLDAPLDVVITLCGDARDACPVFPNPVLRAHWGLADPARVAGDPETVDAAFETSFRQLRARIEALLALPLDTLAHHQLQEELEDIHRRNENVVF